MFLLIYTAVCNWFPGKALPSDLTFSQLTQILLQRGLAPGTTTLSFDITVNTRTIVPPSSLQAALAAAEMGMCPGSSFHS